MPTDADRRLAAFAATNDSVFRTADARDAGLSHAQIDRRVSGWWETIYDGIYRMPGAPRTWRGDLRAACWAAGDDAAISHRAAATHYGLPGRRNDIVELTCRRWERTARPGLVVHERRRIESRDVTLVDGIPVTTPELTLLDLAWLRPSPNYLEAVVHAARRNRLITYESTLETFNRHARRGLRGVRALRIALDRWNPESRPTASEMETWLFQVLRENGLPEPVLQYEVFDERGLFVARVDASLPMWRVTIDYDSKQEHSDEFQLARDGARRNRITAAGYFHFVARHHDLRTGGEDLVEQILTVARRIA